MEGYVNLYLKKNTSIKNLFSNVAAYSIHFTGPINITNPRVYVYLLNLIAYLHFFVELYCMFLCVHLSVYMHNLGGQMAEQKI